MTKNIYSLLKQTFSLPTCYIPQEKVINMASPTKFAKVASSSIRRLYVVLNATPHSGTTGGICSDYPRNLQSGSTTTTKFRSTDNVDFMHTTTQKLEYSYKDAEGHHFMDLETFEDTVLQEDMIGDDEIFQWKETPTIYC